MSVRLFVHVFRTGGCAIGPGGLKFGTVPSLGKGLVMGGGGIEVDFETVLRPKSRSKVLLQHPLKGKRIKGVSRAGLRPGANMVSQTASLLGPTHGQRARCHCLCERGKGRQEFPIHAVYEKKKHMERIGWGAHGRPRARGPPRVRGRPRVPGRPGARGQRGTCAWCGAHE